MVMRTTIDSTRLKIKMVVHGTMTSYNPGTEDWRAYVERPNQCLVANKITSAKRRQAIFLSMCGHGT